MAMEEISLKGENYVKASILARKFGYTADYVGQLCRANAVKATLIGRSWYVNEESLLAHRKGRYRSTLVKSKEMVRKLAEERSQPLRPMNVKRIVRYETDEDELLPSLREKTRTEPERVSPVFEKEETEVLTSENYPAVEERVEPMESRVSIRPAQTAPVARASTRRRPPVRTIPAYAMADITPKMMEMPRTVETSSRAAERPVLEVETTRRSPVTTTPRRKRSIVPALSIIAVLLAAELVLVAGMWGVEKQVTVNKAGSGMILYDFEPELVAAAFRSIMGE